MKNLLLLTTLILIANIAIAQPSNNTCANAIPLVLGASACNGNEVNASNVGATSSGITPPCGNYSGGDIWYSVVVPTSGDVTIITASDGSGSQVNAAMEAYLDCFNGSFAGTCTTSGTLVFTNQTPGTTIYIAVWDQGNDNFGTFNICAWDPDPTAPINNSCAMAIPISCGGIESGTTLHGSDDNPPICIGTNAMSAGVWYSITGIGNDITLTVNPDPGTTNDLGDSQIFLYSGGCNALNCITGNDDGGPFSSQGGSEITFSTTLNTTYHIYIDGFVDNTEGDFELTMSCAPPSNDDCANATMLTLGSESCNGNEVLVNNLNATASGVVHTCGGYSAGDPDIWVSVLVPSSGNVTLQTTAATPPSQVGAVMQAYSDCAGTAIAGGCSNSGGVLTLTGQTPGTTIYIALYDTGGNDEGAFNVCAWNPGPSNETCATAQALTCSSGTVPSTTLLASDDNPGTCNGAGDGNSGGVWYSFTGNGDLITLTVNPDPTTGTSNPLDDSQIAVYTGSCSALICLTGNDDGGSYGNQSGTEVAFLSTSGTTYFIYVDGHNLNEGDFELTIGCVTPPSNSECVDATALTCSSSPIAGTTLGASDDNPGICGNAGDGNSGGVWYSFAGNGGEIVLTVNADPTGSSNTLNDSQIAVYTGSCTGTFTCVIGNDNNTPPGNGGSQVTLTTTTGTNYFIYVDGVGTNEGDFEISISCTPPANNDCANATALTCTSGTLSGTTTNATDDNPPLCSSGGVNSGGVWYSILGNGDFITLTVNADPNGDATDLNDSKINVYTGSCNSTITCVTGNDDNTPPGNGGSQVIFHSDSNETYYIYVEGLSSNFEGDFEISIACSISNQSCANAAVLTCSSGTVIGTTTGATDDNPGACGSVGNDGGDGPSGGVWYSYVGTGNNVTLTVNADPTGSTNPLNDSQIAVYTGSCTATLTCVDGNDDNTPPGNGGSQIIIPTVSGTTYYIYVDGWGLAHEGDFELTISCAPPPNDDCANATALTLGLGSCNGNEVNTANFSATNSGIDHTCGNYNGGDIWFSVVVPNSGAVTLATTADGSGSMVSAEMQAYSDCNGTAISGACNNGNGQMALTGLTPGTTIYIAVWDQGGDDVGTFNICAWSPLPNDTCANAETLTCMSGTVVGTTTGATDDNPLPCGPPGSQGGDGDSGGVWYSFAGNGDLITLTVNADPTGSSDPLVDSQIAVYTGSCTGALSCLDGNDDFAGGNGGSQVQFVANSGTNYFIYVDGVGANAGEFELTMNCEPPNNSCANAEPLTCSSDAVAGTTTNATDNSPPACNGAGDGNAGGVWYTIAGTGDQVTLTVLADPTGTASDLDDSQIAVYTGSCTGALNCVAGNDDTGGNGGSQVSFMTTTGTDYLIYVDGDGSNVGDFEISVTCPPSNNLCSNSTPLTLGSESCGGNEVSASNVGATASGINHTCGGYISGDIWYSVVVPASGALTVQATADNSGSTVGAVMQAYADCNGTPITGGCSSGGVITLIGQTPGATIYIAAWDDGGNDQGSFNICAWALSNDDCVNAFALTCGSGTISGSTTNASNDAPGNCGDRIDSNSGGVWFTFAGNGNIVTLTVNANPTGSSNPLEDSQIGVYTGSCFADFSCVAGNDDNPNGGAGSLVTFTSIAGTTYYIYVDGFGFDEGDFEISINCPNAPANDQCANATALTLGSGTCNGNEVNATNVNATDSGIMHNCGGYVSGDIWFSVMVPASGEVNIQATADNSGSNVSAVMQAYANCNGTTITGGCSAAGLITLTGQTPGATIYIAAWDVGGDNEGTFNICAWEPDLALPVELIDFRARAMEEKVVLEWETASEENNDFFEIEHSRDGLNFEIIGSVVGAGTTRRIQTYEFWHDQPQLESNYYRLKQVDFDGAFEYSEIRVVAFEPEGVKVIVYPNPAMDYINIRMVDNISEKNIQLFDSTGRLVLQRNMAADSNLEVLEVNHLPSGIYWIKVEVDGRSFNNKILLQ